jgi:hypothetical protein
MVRELLPRICVNPRCGEVFAPVDVRQRYHSRDCQMDALNDKRPRKCKSCSRSFHDTGWTLQGGRSRFCSYACRTAYLEKQGRTAVPVAVLLPLGSNPKRTLSNSYFDGTVPERRIFCRRYERCLSYAESQRWSGFDCTKCDVQEPVMPERWSK